MEKWKILFVGVATTALAWSATADVLLDQPVDYRNCWLSIYMPEGPQLGDDFRPAEPVVITSVTFFIVATWPNTPWTYSFSVHRAYLDHDIYPLAPIYEHFFRMINPSTVADLGPWPDDESLHLFEVRFDNVGILLEPGLSDLGVFWFSCAGHILNWPSDQAYLATSGNEVIAGDQGMVKFNPWDWPGWSRMTRYGAEASDFAMRIEGVPASEYQPTTEVVDFKLITGQHGEGDLEGLREAGDGKLLTLWSRPRGPIRRHRITGQATLHCLMDNPDLLDLAISANRERAFGEPPAVVWLRNWTTGEYEQVGNYTIWNEIITWALRDIDAEHYVRREDGVIDLRFEFDINARRMHGQFLANIDRIRIDARRED